MESETTFVGSEAELRALTGEPVKAVLDKDIARIDQHARTIIEHSPFMLLATASAEGRCDVSPRGDPAGSVLVLDDHTLVIADRPGNRRMDSLLNVLANPQVGLLFLVPGMNETLRVNGTARIASDGPFFDRLVVRGKRPALAIQVHVEELYLHCAKAFLRSSLWRPETWPDRRSLPSMGRMAKDQMGIKGVPAKAIDAALALDSRTNQY